jgi:hypothetical protein
MHKQTKIDCTTSIDFLRPLKIIARRSCDHQRPEDGGGRKLVVSASVTGPYSVKYFSCVPDTSNIPALYILIEV